MRKLKKKVIPVNRHLKILQRHGIVFYHLPAYPGDPDDIAFLLCADNGRATHIVSYDKHFKEIESVYSFRICDTLEFLIELRKELLKKA